MPAPVDAPAPMTVAETSAAVASLLGAPDGAQAPQGLAGDAMGAQAQDGQAEQAPPAQEQQAAPQGQEEPDPLARARDDLMRRDRELVERAAELRAYGEQLAEMRAIRETAKSDPAAAIRALGIDPMLALQSVIDGPKAPQPEDQIKSLSQQIAELKQELAGQSKNWSRAQESFRLEQMIRENREHLPTLAALSAEGPRVIEELANHIRPGVSYGQILAEAENSYFGNIMASIKTMVGIPRFADEIKKVLAPAAPSAPQGQSQPQQPQAKAPATINQRMAGEPRTEARQLTDAELRADARQYLEEFAKGL